MEILKKTINISHKDSYTQILLTLWSYRTSIHTPIGATPFSLVYGAKIMISLEIEMPSLCIQLQDLLPELDAQ